MPGWADYLHHWEQNSARQSGQVLELARRARTRAGLQQAARSAGTMPAVGAAIETWTKILVEAVRWQQEAHYTTLLGLGG
jgi:hypothetical protein